MIVDMNKFLTRRTVEAIVSAISALICVFFAGCRIAFSDLRLSNFESDFLSTNSMFHVEH